MKAHSLKKNSMNILFIVLVLLTISLLVSFVHQVVKTIQLESQRAELQEEVAQLEAENISLQGAIEYTESDVYVEQAAREQLNYAREDDTVVVVNFTAPPTESTAAPLYSVPRYETTPNWQRWWNALFVQ